MNTALAQDQATTLYFIRHAEKADASKDPDLSAAGKERAEKWASFFSNKDVAAIYSTPYKRTTETAKPLAQKSRLEIISYDPMKLDLNDIVQKYKGKTVVIVGHSNTIPKYVNQLAGTNAYPDINESEYDHLYTIIIQGNKVTHRVEKI